MYMVFAASGKDSVTWIFILLLEIFLVLRFLHED